MDELPGEPVCPSDGTVLRVQGDAWVCGWCGHHEPLEQATQPLSDGPGIHGG